LARRNTTSSPPPSRSAALAALYSILRHGVAVQPALDKQLGAFCPDVRDKALATELTYGYLRHKGRIDFILHSFLAKPQKLPPLLCIAFGLASYEQLFLDRVPEFATRSWLLHFIRKSWGSGLIRLANAYMTTLQDHLVHLHEEDFYRQDACSVVTFWSRFYSLPSWIVSLWIRAYGEKRAHYLAQTQLLPAFLGLRINPMHYEADALLQGIGNRPELTTIGKWGIGCERNQARHVFSNLDNLYSQGCLSKQSLAAQQVMHFLQVDHLRGPIWDVCAGHGGKTCFLLERSSEPLRASDVHWLRLRGLRQEIQRLGLRNIPVALARADHTLPWNEKPGCILLDAPCSGLGVLSRRPDIKWKRTLFDISSLQVLQRKMLDIAVSSLSPSGRLAYITCTLNPAENEDQIDTLLREQPGLRCLGRYSGADHPELREFFWAALLEKK